MKLLKKLLPIASVASVAAIVAPIATSCNNGNVIDGSKLFIPTVAKAVADKTHEETGYNDADATQLYIKDVDENPEVFVQDIKVILSQLAYYDVVGSDKKQPTPEWKIEWEFSDISVSTIKTAETMSFEVKGSIKVQNSLSMDKQLGVDYIDLTSIDIKATKIPYDAMWTSSWASAGWQYFAPALSPTSTEHLPSGSSFVVTTTGNIRGSHVGSWVSFNNETCTIDKDHAMSDVGTTKWMYPLMLSFFGTNVISNAGVGYSYHMSDITHNPN